MPAAPRGFGEASWWPWSSCPSSVSVLILPRCKRVIKNLLTRVADAVAGCSASYSWPLAVAETMTDSGAERSTSEPERRRRLRLLLVAVATLPLIALLSEPVIAHAAALRGSTSSVEVPTWLFLTTGGGTVGASFLLASFVTDRAFIRSIHDWRRLADAPLARLTTATRVASVLALVGIVALGFL